MKKLNYFLMLLSLLLLFCVDLSAQSEATSPRMSFNIAKEVKPPLWEMVEEPRFIDEDGNNAIDYCRWRFERYPVF